MIGGVFLAAGTGGRFGSQKTLACIDGIPLIVKGLKSCIGSDLDEIVVVLGYRYKQVREEIEKYFPKNDNLKIVVNRNYSKGIISSFNKGLKLLSVKCIGAMMLLGDMPLIGSETINRLIAVSEVNKIILPEVDGKFFHPRIIPSTIFNDFFKLTDLNSGKSIMSRNRDMFKSVLFDNKNEFYDIDTKEDLMNLRVTNFVK